MNKNSNKSKSKSKNAWIDLEVLGHIMNIFELQKVRPNKFKSQICSIEISCLSFENCPTCAIHNLLNFYPMMMILDFLEIPRFLLQTLFFINFEF